MIEFTGSTAAAQIIRLSRINQKVPGRGRRSQISKEQAGRDARRQNLNWN